ncbi:peptidase inhibitor family I36 protein [Streptomyces sp. NPDC007369]|uniref:peptidase inhibitor family I36 protein n=1 Tax=Streptomyces sp. NPDC007369 TaxID=3154589 RepID=UPI0033E27CDF
MRRIVPLLFATVTAACLAAAVPAAAEPASSPAAAAAVSTFEGSNCPADSLCLYRDYNFTGGGIALRAGDHLPWLGAYGFNDHMSSWSNDSGTVCYWWTDAYSGGEGHDMKNGYRVNVLPQENDMASSVRCY